MCTGIEIGLMFAAGAGALMTAKNGFRAQADAGAQAHQMEMDADTEQAAAVDRAGLIKKAGDRTRGNARAQYGASGVDVNEGSPVAIDQQIGQDVNHDAWSELLTGQSAARRTRAQADMVRRGGKAFERNAEGQAAGSLLASGASIYRSGWSTAPRPEQYAAPISSRTLTDRTLRVND